MGIGIALRKPFEQVKELERSDEVVKILVRNSKTGEYNVIKAVQCRANPVKEYHCRTEAEILEKAYHPHLARTYEHWTENDMFFLSQELVQGIDLESYVAQCRSLKPRDKIVRLVRVFKDVASAIGALHAAGVVLGRITAQEVFVESTGIPKFCYNALVYAEKSVGRMKNRVALQATIAALSPEELKGKETGLSSDIYAFGALMYGFFTGTPPVSVTKYEEVADAVWRDEVRKPSLVNPEIPADLEALVMKCLDRDPAKRPENMGQVFKSLVDLLALLRPAGVTTTRMLAAPFPGQNSPDPAKA